MTPAMNPLLKERMSVEKYCLSPREILEYPLKVSIVFWGRLDRMSLLNASRSLHRFLKRSL